MVEHETVRKRLDPRRPSGTPWMPLRNRSRQSSAGEPAERWVAFMACSAVTHLRHLTHPG